MGKPMADYVKLPELEEYKEWFKDFADLYREDGILQVTWKTLDGPMHHSGMSHRAMSQLTRWLSLDFIPGVLPLPVPGCGYSLPRPPPAL